MIDKKKVLRKLSLLEWGVTFLLHHSWWFQTIRKLLVKLAHFPKDRGENEESFKPPPSGPFLDSLHLSQSRHWVHWGPVPHIEVQDCTEVADILSEKRCTSQQPKLPAFLLDFEMQICEVHVFKIHWFACRCYVFQPFFVEKTCFWSYRCRFCQRLEPENDGSQTESPCPKRSFFRWIELKVMACLVENHGPLPIQGIFGNHSPILSTSCFFSRK